MKSVKQLLTSKKFLIAIGVLILVFVLFTAFIYITALSLKLPYLQYIKPSLKANLIGEGISLSNGSQNLVPYSIISINAINESSIHINTSFFKRPPPTRLFILDPSQGCFECGNYQQMISYLSKDLIAFGVPNAQNFNIISNPDNVTNDSILLIFNGYMPNYMFSSTQANNSVPLIQSLLQRGVSIIYVGRNFSDVLNGPVVVPSNNTPQYLNTEPAIFSGNTMGFYINNPEYRFINGSEHGAISYENIMNGSIIAFPNTLSSWNSTSESGYDIARAISEIFWLPKYSYYSSSLNITSLSYDTNTVVQLRTPLISISELAALTNFTSGTATTSKNSELSAYNFSKYMDLLNTGEIRTLVTTSSNHSLSKGSDYIYLYYSPNYLARGQFSMPYTIVPGVPVDSQFTVYTGSEIPELFEPRVYIFNSTMSKVAEIPLTAIQNVSGNYTFVVPLSIDIAPGNYIAELRDIYNVTYASASFHIDPIFTNITGGNLTDGIINFSVSSDGIILSGIPYVLTMNGEYPQNGTLDGGILTYTLPKGSPIPKGRIEFRFAMLSSNFTAIGYNGTAGLNNYSQLIELGVVLAMVFILVVFVKSPINDSFTIDVPDLPPHKMVDIELKSDNVVSTFDKLNSYYHWKYMPLSTMEVRIAISNYLRYGNMPINLTLNNVDSILTQLVGNGKLYVADGLYAPKEWTERIGHDIRYLSTFKKLRMFMVTHAIMFTEIDTSNEADIVISVHGEKHLIIINSATTKFKRIPVSRNSKTYIAFLNKVEMYDFLEVLNRSRSKEAEEFRIFLSTGYVILVDADNPNIITT